VATVSEIVLAARDILQDHEQTYRYSDASLLRLVNQALLEIRRVRPDYFIGTFHRTVPRVTGLADTVPAPETLIPPIVRYVSGMAEMRDDEFTTDGRAAGLLDAFRKDLTG
jgi:hypothetical protein